MSDNPNSNKHLQGYKVTDYTSNCHTLMLVCQVISTVDMSSSVLV